MNLSTGLSEHQIGSHCSASDGIGRSFDKISYSEEIIHNQKEATPFCT